MDITNVAPRDIEYSAPKPTEQPTPGTSSHDAAEGAKKPPRFSVRNNLFMWALTAAEIVASILVVQWVTSHGGTEFAAYLWSMLPPLVGGVIYWAKTRVLGGASLAILVFNLLSAGVALLGSHDAKVLLYKDCFVTGIIAVIFAASTVVGRPVTYWYGQRFATGGTPEGLAWWRDLWANVPGFRKLQRQVCLVWAAILMIEAGSKAFAISQNSFDNAYVWTQVLPIAAIVLGMVMTMRMVRRTLARVRSTPASSDRSYR